MNECGFKNTNDLFIKNNTKNHKLNQNSDIFSYYFLKSGMLDNIYINFNKFNKKNSKDTSKSKIYFDISNDKVEDLEKLFYENFEINKINIDNLEKNNKLDKKQKNSLRMTIIE